MVIATPAHGAYQVIITGLALGRYTLFVNPYSADGTAQPVASIQGIAGVGLSKTFQIQFASAPGAASTAVPMVTFQSVLDDINNSLQLGPIDNAGIANSLSSKINAASGGDKNVLTAFINEVTAQVGVHIIGIAPQILVNDANSLLAQP